MDVLALVTGSRVRADLIEAVFGGRVRSWKPLELGKATGRSSAPIYRELRKLVSAGLLRAAQAPGPQRFEPDLQSPVARELRGLVVQTRGRVPRIRHALVRLRARSIAWAVGSSLKGADGRTSLVVLTSAPRSLVRVQLTGLVDRTAEIHCVSVSEWVARLDKGDVFLREARRARKLWILGDWEELVRRERAELESKKLLRAVRSNWRDELSDEWDEDWDPFAPAWGAS